MGVCRIIDEFGTYASHILRSFHRYGKHASYPQSVKRSASAIHLLLASCDNRNINFIHSQNLVWFQFAWSHILLIHQISVILYIIIINIKVVN